MKWWINVVNIRVSPLSVSSNVHFNIFMPFFWILCIIPAQLKSEGGRFVQVDITNLIG